MGHGALQVLFEPPTPPACFSRWSDLSPALGTAMGMGENGCAWGWVADGSVCFIAKEACPMDGTPHN